MIPSLRVQKQGQGVVGADDYNSYVQTVDTVASLRTFVGLTNMQVSLEGLSAANDGGQGLFYWNGTSTATDDGMTVIRPNGVTTGAWLRLGTVGGTPLFPPQYNAPLNLFGLTVPPNCGGFLLDPAGTLAAGSLTMPASPWPWQLVTFSTTHTITTLTLNASGGQTIRNAVSTLTAGPLGSVRYQFWAGAQLWLPA